MKHLILYLLFFFAFAAYGGSTSHTDSLIGAFNKSENKLDRFQLALNISLDYFNLLETDQAKKYLDFGYENLVESIPIQLAYCQYGTGIYFTRINEYDTAEVYLMKALESAQDFQDNRLIYWCYNMLATVYSQQSNVYLANSYLFPCLSYYTSIGDTSQQLNIYNQIGFNYSQYDEFEQGLTYFLKSYELSEQMNDIDGLSSSLINAGYCLEMLGRYDEALDYYSRSLALHLEMGVEEYAAYSYVLMGTMYANLQKNDSAFYYLKLSDDLLTEAEDFYGLSYVYYGYAIYYKNLGDLNASQKNALLGLEYSDKSAFVNNEIRLLLFLQEVYVMQKKYKEAYETFVAYTELNNSVKNPLNSKEIAGLEYKFEYSTKHLSDSLAYDKEIKISSVQHDEEIKRYWAYSLAGSVLILVLLVFALVVVRNSKIRKRKNEELIEKNSEIQSQKNQIELTHFELEVKNKEILDSILYAKRIQSAILPPQKIVKEYLKDSFILYKPKDIVAGDFYWLEQKDNKVIFAAADCTGHGVPGAMVSVVCNNGLNRAVREYGLTDPGEILNKTREIVINEFDKSEEDVKDGMDIALCSLENFTLNYAGANNPLWIIRKNQNEIVEIKANKQPIGKFENKIPYTTHTVQLNPGDTFYIFTDGYTDQFGGDPNLSIGGKKFKASNFKKMLLQLQHESMEKQHQIISAEFEKWKGKLEQVDDVCIIGVRV